MLQLGKILKEPNHKGISVPPVPTLGKTYIKGKSFIGFPIGFNFKWKSDHYSQQTWVTQLPSMGFLQGLSLTWSKLKGHSLRAAVFYGTLNGQLISAA